jgi:arabinogalactan oligomer/maltooligosaccharide transport system permease protein
MATTETTATTAEPVKLGSAKGNWFVQVGWRHLVAVVAMIWAIFPVLFVVSAAFNPRGTLSSTDIIPSDFSTVNFTNLFERTDFENWFVNSIVIATVSAVVAMFLSALAAFSFSRYRFRGRRGGLMFLLLVQMFPQFLAVVAIYIMFATITDLYPQIGFNTWWGLILLYMGGALGVNTWLMKGFFDTIPKDLDESAKVDGATHTQIFFGIIFPLVRPILAVVGLLSFISTINEFLMANVFLTESTAKTLAVGLFGLIAGERNANFGIFCAGTLLTAIPTVALFFSLQKYIVGGLTAGAVKG